jgi:hypothetical protein
VEATCAALDAQWYSDSLAVSGGLAFAMVRKDLDKHLLLLYEDRARAADFVGTDVDAPAAADPTRLKLCPLTPANAAALRKHLPFAGPVTLNKGCSIGTGDRLGLATPGHIRAIRRSRMRPVLAQQSIREMTRTQRSAVEVLDDATWGVFQAGYRSGFAADADHLKSADDIDVTRNAGFTMYTIDPSDHVDSAADDAPAGELAARFAALLWDALRSTPDDCRRAYADRTFAVQGDREALELAISGEDLLRAAVKYGRAIAHTAAMYEHLLGRCSREGFTFEVSVDETATPTSAAEHFYVASELKRLGVTWDGLAPRFVGEFYKGVDYVGDLAQFRAEFAKHVLIAQHFGSYKLSLHSGSDKFTLYPILAELGGDLIHVKTAGTSYLEALRVVALTSPDLFRKILAFAKERFAMDAATYHVSADVRRVAGPADLKTEELPGVLDQPDTRQACHVTFGSVLTTRTADGGHLFRDELFAVLRREEETYHRLLEEHFVKHVRPFG